MNRQDTFPRLHAQINPCRVLTVGEDGSARRTLDAVVLAAGWTPVAAYGPRDACEILASAHGPRLALVDWRAPGTRGHDRSDVIREIRALLPSVQPYLILVTPDPDADDVLSGLDAGADDYMVTPRLGSVLQARLRVGLRTLAMQERLGARMQDLEAAAAQIKQLQNLLPICSYCRRIRDDEHQWQHLDEYLSDRTHVRFTHGFCPQCYVRHVQPSLEAS